MPLTLCCPTLLGLESLVADELRFGGGLDEVQSENGRVLFSGDWRTVAWANLHLRCAERVLIRVGVFEAREPDQLFEGVQALPWEQFIPQDGCFPVKGHSLNSVLRSVPNCQKTIKKAVALRLGRVYGQEKLEESGALYQIQFALRGDRIELFLDTSGDSLHKRGYRKNANAAPLRETLAAAMLKLARWRGRQPMLDPFCGSGTIAIEAAWMAQNRAPGLNRSFAAERWQTIEPNVFQQARAHALEQIDLTARPEIEASDIDSDCVALSMDNARKAGVEGVIRFTQADARTLDYQRPGVLFANPPYGERLLDVRAAQQLYTAWGRAVGNSPMRQYILSADTLFEQYYGRRADKRRKLYNGMIACQLYQYFRHALPPKQPR